eukprot:scaffold499455_cov38-Prasinocladus_malaysianus.AAC.2
MLPKNIAKRLCRMSVAGIIGDLQAHVDVLAVDNLWRQLFHPRGGVCIPAGGDFRTRCKTPVGSSSAI